MGACAVERVLVVDDDDLILSAFRRGFTYAQRKVFTTKDPKAARRLAQTERVDLAVVDLRLDSASGIDLICELKCDNPQLKVVLMSGYLSVAYAVDAVKAGADVVVHKPVTVREILHRAENNVPHSKGEEHKRPSLELVQYEHIMRVVADCGGNISEAARQLGIARQSLQRRLRRSAPKR